MENVAFDLTKVYPPGSTLSLIPYGKLNVFHIHLEYNNLKTLSMLTLENINVNAMINKLFYYYFSLVEPEDFAVGEITSASNPSVCLDAGKNQRDTER
jgi:hypothetical protein